MTDTIFWSWQDDLPASSNREFIRECLAIAVKQVGDALDVDDSDRVDLDHDTKGAQGMVDISQTILKKIRASAVMVADVTPIGKTNRGKPLPNPNVMVELGYAMNAIGFERIIPVLNNAHGSTDTLPFDIRNRRILTYALSTDATKNERKAKREALIRELVAAIKKNISEVRNERSATADFKVADSDSETAGLWQAKWPIEHFGPFNMRAKVNPVQVSRAWLRVIPHSFPKGIPPISAFYKLPDSARLRAPMEVGPCDFGFVTYWISKLENGNPREAYNLAAFLEETGEVWMSDGRVFYDHDNSKRIDYDNLLSNWARGLDNAMACLDELKASKLRRAIVGIEGLKNSFWRVGYQPAPSRKTEMVHDATKRKWSDQDQTEFLMRAWNKLRNAFSLDQITEERFAEDLQVRKRIYHAKVSTSIGDRCESYVGLFKRTVK